MARTYVKGTWVLGECERCGRNVLLRELQTETIQGLKTNNRVCPECWDVDHPQNFLGEVRIIEPQAVYDPRPPTDLQQVRALTGFQPIGNPATIIQVKAGQAHAS